MTKALDNREICATVRIRVPATKGNPDGILEINKTDYDAAKHQLVDEGAQPSLDLTNNPPPPVPAPAPAADDTTPKGSAVLAGRVDVGAKDPLEAGMISGLAHSRSGLDIAAWNALPDESREKLIADELTLIRNANGYKAPGPFSP